ncbi:MAG: hypothetical protein NC089_06850 [Bacteroides sp.]|nr:hypothetical protein [Bacteroides sp.]MCM1548433.1 hypothetical protein [Clostridium sp.]
MKKCIVSDCKTCKIKIISKELGINNNDCEIVLIQCVEFILNHLSKRASRYLGNLALCLLRQSEIKLMNIDNEKFLKLCLVEVQNEIALGIKNYDIIKELSIYYQTGYKQLKWKECDESNLVELNMTYDSLIGQVYHLIGNYHDAIENYMNNYEKYPNFKFFKAQYSSSLYLNNGSHERSVSRNISEELFNAIQFSQWQDVEYFIAAKFLEHLEKVGESEKGIEMVLPLIEYSHMEPVSLSAAINMSILLRDIGQSLWLCGDNRYNSYLSRSKKIVEECGLRDQERKIESLEKRIDFFENNKIGGNVYMLNQNLFLCDYLVVTIRSDELNAAIYHIANGKTSSDKKTQWRKANVEQKSGKRALVVFVSIGQQGNLSACDYLYTVLELLKPKKIILVGIAGSVPCTDVGLGDVVLCRNILDFSVGAVNSDNTREYAVSSPDGSYNELRNIGPMISQWSKELKFGKKIFGYETGKVIEKPWKDIEDIKFVGDKKWKEKLKKYYFYHKENNIRECKAVFGTIATSDNVIKSPKEVELWLKAARTIYAIEMEATGVILAANKYACPVIIVRGISDIVGQERDDEWVYYAVNSAAAFASEIIKNEII